MISRIFSILQVKKDPEEVEKQSDSKKEKKKDKKKKNKENKQLEENVEVKEEPSAKATTNNDSKIKADYGFLKDPKGLKRNQSLVKSGVKW